MARTNQKNQNPGADRHTVPFGTACFKRTLDVVLGGAALLVAAPLILSCLIIVKLIDPGPAMYCQWRVGRNGRMFRIYKLRTMWLDAEHDSGAVFASAVDDRVLPACRWMRRSHVDELPQLWNILRGEMSLVGPRPERPEIIDALIEKLPRFEQRLAVPPGLTGLAQICNGYTNDVAGARKKLSYDLLYIRQISWINELKLLAGTVPKLWDRAAC